MEQSSDITNQYNTFDWEPADNSSELQFSEFNYFDGRRQAFSDL